VLIRESIKDVEPITSGRQQTLKNKAADGLPLIWVDPDMIHRMFINLLENASKFTPSGGLIEIGAQTSDGEFIKFWVSDNGLGISEADLDRIFEKFTRMRGKNNPSGIGVGLAFCKLAVQGHGGQIWVESVLGKGTTFWLTLPVAKKRATGQLKRQTGRLVMKEDRPFRSDNR
jgi:signal transduction histidine kinase